MTPVPANDLTASAPPIDDDSASDTLQFPCRQCGSSLTFEPGSSELTCPYCQFRQAITPGGSEVSEQDFLQAIAEQQDQDENQSVTVLDCKNCGAKLEQTDGVKAGSCPYCASPMVANNQQEQHLKPHGLLPFMIKTATAESNIQTWLKKLWFAPSHLSELIRPEERLQGIYMPYWTFDCSVDTAYHGERGTHYYVTTTHTVNGKTTTRQERRTRWRSCSGQVSNHFDDVLVIATGRLPEEQVIALEPWPLSDIQPYKADFLSGFRAEQYQLPLADGFRHAQQRMASIITRSIKKDIGGDDQRIHHQHSDYHGITYKYILLPLYLCSFRFKERSYQVLVNATTGEVQGERPYSWLKIGLTIFLGLLLLGVIIFFATGR